MKLLIACLAVLLVILSLLGSGAFPLPADEHSNLPLAYNDQVVLGRLPLDKFSWRPTFGLNIGNGQPAHSGEDLIAPCGTPVRASFNGEIVYRGCLYGNCHDGGVAAGATGHGLVIVQDFAPYQFAVYAHLNDFTNAPSAQAGDILGHVGLTGWTTGCHLHFAIWHGTLDEMLKGDAPQWVDPKKYLPLSSR